MWAKQKFSPFPELKLTPEKPVTKTGEIRYWLTNFALLFFAVWFWVSAVMRLFLETDYFFDVFFYNLGTNFLGNMLMVLGVIFLPGLNVGFNGIEFMQKKQAKMVVMATTSFLLMAMGFLAVATGR